ncbi:PLD nuclease N-terminal domain-containing protein [Gryllotalpicola ginsengisoli]|uniref:PLD nuclease N-terminal domain-containing protein n=1 Tax=Gryllotalpicola ginsengisoli TaxID=444608 RepID=UPI0003B6EBBB|nr:PLD nuclease N-terminal domain-containing protein [Gryllotalpicola ginsengisoli]
MFRLWLVIGFIAAVFYIYSIAHVALADRLSARGLPKAAWIAVVVVFPLIGAALWFSIGHDRARRSGPIAPDDDAEFLASLGNRPKNPGDGPDA